MRGLRPAATGLARRALAPRRQQQQQQPFSASSARRAGTHGPQYDPPGGHLWGIKPGEKAPKEGWENLFYYGYGGSLLVFAVAYAFKPDTS